MKQKDILLWTIAIAALLLSVLATFGSRINGLQTFAAKRAVVATTSQLATGVSGTPTFGGSTVIANGQGPATCEAMRDYLDSRFGNLQYEIGNAGELGERIAAFIETCGAPDAEFCNALDQAGTHQYNFINDNPNYETTDDDITYLWNLYNTYNMYCGPGGGSVGADSPGYNSDPNADNDLLRQICRSTNTHTGICQGY